MSLNIYKYYILGICLMGVNLKNKDFNRDNDLELYIPVVNNILDYSKNSYNINYNGSLSYTTNTNSNSNRALYLDDISFLNVDGAVFNDIVTRVNAGSEVYITGWFKYDSTVDYNVMYSNWGVHPNRLLEFAYNNSATNEWQLKLLFDDDTTADVVWGSSTYDDAWVFTAIKLKKGDFRLYVDDVTSARTTNTTNKNLNTTNVYDFFIGESSSDTQANDVGDTGTKITFSDFRIYFKDISTDELTTIKNDFIIYKNPTFWLPLDKKAVDESGNNYEVSINGGATITDSKIGQLLLNRFSGNELAFSMWKVNANYTGACMNVRRAIDDDTKDIFFTNDLMLDVAEIETFSLGGDVFVKTWYDQSGNGRNATQNTSGSQPKIVEDGSVILQNDKPAMYFDGGDVLEVSDFSYNTSDLYSIILSTPTLSSTRGYIIGHYDTSSQRSWAIAYENTGKIIGVVSSNGNSGVGNAKVFSSTDDYELEQQLIEFQFTTDDIDMYLDGSSLSGSITQTAIVNAIHNSTSPLEIGDNTSVSQTHPFYVQEYLIWDSDQSSNRSSIAGDINDRYSIYAGSSPYFFDENNVSNFDKVYQFDGTNDYIEFDEVGVDLIKYVNNGGTAWFTAWVKIDGTGVLYMPIFSRYGDTTAKRSFFLSYDNYNSSGNANNWAFITYYSDDTYDFTTWNPGTDTDRYENEWTFVAIKFKKGDIQLYVDDLTTPVITHSTNKNLKQGSNRTMIGWLDGQTSIYYFKGQIHDVRVIFDDFTKYELGDIFGKLYISNNDASNVFDDDTNIVWDSTRGYHRALNVWGADPVNINVSNLDKISSVTATIYGYWNTPTSCLGDSRIIVTFDDSSTVSIGTNDAWVATGDGHTIYKGDSGTEVKVQRNVIGETYSIATPTGRYITSIKFSSYYYPGYNPSDRGIRDIIIEYKSEYDNQLYELNKIKNTKFKAYDYTKLLSENNIPKIMMGSKKTQLDFKYNKYKPNEDILKLLLESNTNDTGVDAYTITNNGATQTTGPDGSSNKAYSFNNDNIEIPYSFAEEFIENYNLGKNVSIMFWLKRNGGNANASEHIFGQYDASATYERPFGIWYVPGSDELKFVYKDVGSNFITTGSTFNIEDGLWNFIYFDLKKGSQKIYINDIKTPAYTGNVTANIIGASTSYPCYVGAEYSGRYWNGDISNFVVTVGNRSLYEREVEDYSDKFNIRYEYPNAGSNLEIYETGTHNLLVKWKPPKLTGNVDANALVYIRDGVSTTTYGLSKNNLNMIVNNRLWNFSANANVYSNSTLYADKLSGNGYVVLQGRGTSNGAYREVNITTPNSITSYNGFSVGVYFWNGVVKNKLTMNFNVSNVLGNTITTEFIDELSSNIIIANFITPQTKNYKLVNPAKEVYLESAEVGDVYKFYHDGSNDYKVRGYNFNMNGGHEININSTTQSATISVISRHSFPRILSNGQETNMYIDENGLSWGAGLGWYGMIGNGGLNQFNSTFLKTVFPAGSSVHQVGLHQFHTTWLDHNHKPWVGGRNVSGGALGINSGSGSRVTPVSPIFPASASSIIQIDCGWYTSIAIDSNYDVWSWGNNLYGSVGDNTTVSRRTPVKITGQFDSTVTIVSVNATTYMKNALDHEGNVWSWGYNLNGGLGHGDYVNKSSPVKVTHPDGKKFVSIKNNNVDMFLMDEDCKVWTCGYNVSNVRGTANTSSSFNILHSVILPTSVHMIQMKGGRNTADGALLLDGNNDTWTWGANANWNGGLGILYSPGKVVLTLSTKNITYIESGGRNITLADDNTYWGWGRSWRGELAKSGTGTTASAMSIVNRTTAGSLKIPNYAKANVIIS